MGCETEPARGQNPEKSYCVNSLLGTVLELGILCSRNLWRKRMEIISSTSREGKHITNIYSHQCTKFYCNLLTSLEMLRLGSKSTDMKSISCQDIVGLTLSPRLEFSGTVIDHCSLKLLCTSDPPTSASREAEIV
ncbi:hypothetical protein CR201_G0008731 [Pongo abelii]|uniref:Uncharacterized protein n=1 Tax=Pongo abelii TaxID=9601 RepID=A0A2J8WQC9_PONAB|nr:hypothetical protein CR201_G0008731 [Pongo abelii]